MNIAKYDATLQACIAAYGPQGEHTADAINSGNREHIRKHLIARDVASSVVVRMTISELRRAWHDEDFVQSLKDGTTEPVSWEPEPLPHEPTVTREDTTPVAAIENTAPASTIEAAIRAIAESVAPRGASVDAEAVRRIVADEIARAMLPTPLEITVNNERKGQLPALRHKQTEELLAVILADVRAYVVGPAGSGKTTAAEQVAEALGLTFYMSGAMGGSHEVVGYMDAYGKYQRTPFRQAFEHGGVFLADEIDGSDANAVLSLNAALANGYMAFPDKAEPVKVHADFRFIAAANTFGNGANRVYVGRNQLDGATLDRFAFMVWDYDEKLERQLCANSAWVGRVQSIRAAVAKLNLRHIVSPRASINGAKLLDAGLSQTKVENMLIWRDMSGADRQKVEANI